MKYIRVVMLELLVTLSTRGTLWAVQGFLLDVRGGGGLNFC